MRFFARSGMIAESAVVQGGQQFSFFQTERKTPKAGVAAALGVVVVVVVVVVAGLLNAHMLRI